MLTTRFLDRRDAGRHLASALRPYARRADVLVFGLPRGGVPVASVVAAALDAPLDVLIVRKLGVPGHEELAMGAVASGGVKVLNRELIEHLKIPQESIDAVTASELAELARREVAYRGDTPPADVAGRTVILVDDGLATGASMSAAVAAVRQLRPSRVVVATPVASREAITQMRRLADDCICVLEPEPFYGVGAWYADFAQTTDREVRDALAESHERSATQTVHS